MRNSELLSGLSLTTSVREAFFETDDNFFVMQPDGTRIIQSTNLYLMALMLENLRIEQGQNVLEIGTGSGYNAALLSNLVGAEGNIHTIEVDLEVADRAIEKLESYGVNNVKVICGDGFYGHDQPSKYDRIIAAAKPPFIPQPWIEQLNPSGILVSPIDLDDLGGTFIVAFVKRSETRLESIAIIPGGFIPMAHTPDRLLIGPPAKHAKSNREVSDLTRIIVFAHRSDKRKQEWLDHSLWDHWDFEYINL